MRIVISDERGNPYPNIFYYQTEVFIMKKSLVKLVALSSAAFVLAGGIAPVVTTYAQSETSVVDNSIKSAEAKVAEAKAAKEVSDAKVKELRESFNTLKAADNKASKDLNDAKIELTRLEGLVALAQQAFDNAVTNINSKARELSAADEQNKEEKQTDYNNAVKALAKAQQDIALAYKDVEEQKTFVAELDAAHKAALEASDAKGKEFDAAKEELNKVTQNLQNAEAALEQAQNNKLKLPLVRIEAEKFEKKAFDSKAAAETAARDFLANFENILYNDFEVGRNGNEFFVKFAVKDETPGENKPDEDKPATGKIKVSIYVGNAEEPIVKVVDAKDKAEALAKVKAMYPGKEVKDMEMGAANELTVKVTDKAPGSEKDTKENNEVGFKTKAAAEAAAKKALATDKVNKSFTVSQNATSKKWFYVLHTEEKVETTKEKEAEKTVDPLLAGYKTAEDAIKAAEELLKKMPWNNGYDIQQGADNLFYIRLTTDGTKTVNRKAVETTKEAKKDKKEKLPETGEVTSYAIFGSAALTVLAGLGLVAPKFKEEN